MAVVKPDLTRAAWIQESFPAIAVSWVKEIWEGSTLNELVVAETVKSTSGTGLARCSVNGLFVGDSLHTL